MCYPKPGPRCSPHARQKLFKSQKALEKYTGTDNERFQELKESFVKAQKEYFTSPQGIKLLKDKAQKTGNDKYAKQAEEFFLRRKNMIEEYKNSINQNNHAPVPSANSPSVVQVTKLSAPKEHYRLPVDYDYDYYSCSGATCNSDGYDDYCRDSEYEGLRIDKNSLNTRSVLAYIYNAKEEDIPDDMVIKANNELELDTEDGYEVYSSPGYYGDEATIDFAFPDNARKALERYYYELPDATDNSGVLPYVRGKGIDTTGLTPIEAIKKQLTDENNGKTHQFVDRANRVSSNVIPFHQVEIPQQKHFDSVEPREPAAPKNVDNICGVLVKIGEGKTATYRLVDGYHRMKNEKLKNAKSGKFIVLSIE